MEFGVLGPLEVVYGGRRLDLGGHKQRAVLAMLVLEPNRVITVERMVDSLWDGQPPAQAVGTLRAYVSNLRRMLEPDRPPGTPARVLVGEPPGYVLRVEPERIDARRFEQLVDEARGASAAGDPSSGMRLLEEALALWRGPALADFADEPFTWTEAARLEECRLAAVEQHAEAALACGQHSAVVAELERLVREHPLRERLRGHLMVALYRCGRQADALRAYDAGRRILAEELGIDPSPDLQELERAILVQDRALDLPTTSAGRVHLSDSWPAPPHAGLVGRDAELDVLRRALSEARAGRGRVVLVAGEAGIGKTRLAGALAAHAADAGATVVWGAAHDGDGAPPFWPWVQIVRRLVEATGPNAVQVALGRDAAEIAQIVPEVAEEVPGAAITPPADPELARFRLYDALTRFLLRLSRMRPLVLVVDDLHWADVPTLQLVSFLAAAVRDAPVLLVATYRDREVPGVPALSQALAALARQPAVTRVVLGGLAVEDVRELVTGAIPHSAPASDEMAATLHRRTDGNPFFLVELLRLLGETGSLDTVPAGVRDVVRHNLGRLPAECRDLLAVAAVVGDTFEVDVVGAAAGRGDEETLALVERAIEAGMVVETDALGGYRFSHALTRETVYEGLSALRRARLHGKVGAALAVRYEAGRRELVSEIAEHFLRASTIGYVREAVAYAETAAYAAFKGLAFEQAERHVHNALELLPKLPPDAGTSRLELRLRLTLGSLLFTSKGYSDPAVLPTLSRALDLCRHAGTRRELLSTLWGMWAYAIGRPDLPMARKLSEELLDEGRRTGDLPYLVAGHSAAAMVNLHEGELLEAHDHLEELVRLAESGDVRTIDTLLRAEFSDIVLEKHPCVGGLAIYGVERFLSGDDAGAEAAFAAAHAWAERVGQPFGIAMVHIVECAFFAMGGMPARVLPLAERGIAIARDRGFRQWDLMLTAMRGWARAHQGDLEAADQMAAAVDQLAASGNGMVQHALLGLLAGAYRQAGRLGDALSAAERGLKASDTTGERFMEAELHRLRGELLLAISAERHGEARQSLETALVVARRQRALAFQQRAEASLARLLRADG